MSTVGQVLFSFFEDHLKVQKGLRPGSVKSYRDTMKLFLGFVARTCRKPVTRLALTDLSSQRVLEFLQMIEIQRHNKPQTRNQRLAALHTFYRFLATHHCEMLSEAERVEAIPSKRAPPPQTHYLEREDVEQLFQALAAQGNRALRDRALLMLLYNTGARVQEVADLRVSDLDLDGPLRVRLHGKGDKWRACPLWPETAVLLRQLDTVQAGDAQAALFVSSRQQPLTRFGIYKLVRRHTQGLVNGGDQRKAVSPHTFRHTTAVRLLEAGVEPNVIRAWLGHVSLDTTNRYAEITMRTKEAALAACMPPVSSAASLGHIRWRQDQDLMKWLQSL